MDRFELLVCAVVAVISALTITGVVVYMVAAYLDKKRGDD
ncbi:hypothetical protein PSWA111526_06680 [Pseudomonas wadenswilerensis]|uniref:Uncharacterized protein n=1 Tax=Pseudomonas wadenswilerensis TaxID=1785161 RepID=A0A380STY6_9PSED|nr:hypothetical protein CCOS864_00852 [Pseudomonas wadenswilerensis]